MGTVIWRFAWFDGLQKRKDLKDIWVDTAKYIKEGDSYDIVAQLLVKEERNRGGYAPVFSFLKRCYF